MLRLPLLLIFALPAAAAEGEAPGLPAASFLQAMLALALIVGLLFAAAWLARKISGGKGFGQGGMQVVGGVALGPRERVVLVEIGDTWLVIGIVPGQIRTLHRLPKGELQPGPGGGPEANFSQWLKAVSERRRDA